VIETTLNLPTLSRVALLLAVTACLPSAARAQNRPNIVLFLSDDHGQALAGCYGNPVIRTPHMDALARSGMRFTRVFAASPTCTPSRSSLFTGLYPARHGAMGNHTDCRPGIKALPGYLRPLGYRVVLAHKADVRPPTVFDFELIAAALPRDPAIKRHYRAEGLDTRAVDRLLADHARDHREQPLCLIVADSGPHVVWEENKTYDPAALPIAHCMVDTPKTRTALANYYQDITTVDGRLGAVLDSIRRHGFEDNTLFLYSSDQGPEWPRCKWTVYDTGLLVPLLVRWPGRITPGAVADAIVSQVDILPTLVDVAAGTVGGDAPIDGLSFKDVLLGRRADFRDRIFATHTGDGEMNVFPQRCVRDRRFKYILNLRPENTWTTHFTKVPGIPNSHKEVWDTWIEKARTDPGAARLVDAIEHHPAEELYDTQADPDEFNNLAGVASVQPVLTALRQELRRWMVAQGDPEAR
jgi:arylsulfatase A-like enzyme